MLTFDRMRNAETPPAPCWMDRGDNLTVIQTRYRRMFQPPSGA
jgi:hypothetical protein